MESPPGENPTTHHSAKLLWYVCKAQNAGVTKKLVMTQRAISDTMSQEIISSTSSARKCGTPKYGHSVLNFLITQAEENENSFKYRNYQIAKARCFVKQQKTTCMLSNLNGEEF